MRKREMEAFFGSGRARAEEAARKLRAQQRSLLRDQKRLEKTRQTYVLAMKGAFAQDRHSETKKYARLIRGVDASIEQLRAAHENLSSTQTAGALQQADKASLTAMKATARAVVQSDNALPRAHLAALDRSHSRAADSLSIKRDMLRRMTAESREHTGTTATDDSDGDDEVLDIMFAELMPRVPANLRATGDPDAVLDAAADYLPET